jgi:hypothetical protein
MTRLFYVLYIPDTKIRACVDTIRYLANPDEKHEAHITVRGPYERAIDHEALNKSLTGNVITIDGVGTFDNGSHSVVYFRADGTHLRNVWDKSDFPYNPHVTLYDGSSRALADELERVLSGYRYHLQFVSDRLYPMVSVGGTKRFDLLFRYDADFMAPVLGARRTAVELQCLPVRERLVLIDRICQHLSELSEYTGDSGGKAESA